MGVLWLALKILAGFGAAVLTAAAVFAGMPFLERLAGDRTWQVLLTGALVAGPLLLCLIDWAAAVGFLLAWVAAFSWLARAYATAGRPSRNPSEQGPAD